jgi:hypothetical protein
MLGAPVACLPGEGGDPERATNFESEASRREHHSLLRSQALLLVELMQRKSVTWNEWDYLHALKLLLGVGKAMQKIYPTGVWQRFGISTAILHNTRASPTSIASCGLSKRVESMR